MVSAVLFCAAETQAQKNRPLFSLVETHEDTSFILKDVKK